MLRSSGTRGIAPVTRATRYDVINEEMKREQLRVPRISDDACYSDDALHFPRLEFE